MADNEKTDDGNSIEFIRYLYLASALGISLINYGTLESILVSRNICLVIVIIANIIIILKQVKNKTPNAAVNISILVLFIIILISYIYYINKSYTLDKSDSILSNTYSSSFITLFIILCVYMSYYMSFEMKVTQYCVLLVFCSVMICLLYPLIITIIYYKTDGFKNIYI
jgi:hypothetical protein